MAERERFRRVESSWFHVDKDRHRQRLTQRCLVKDLVDRAFSETADQTVMQDLLTRRLSSDELSLI